jgi:hypothetical protein
LVDDGLREAKALKTGMAWMIEQPLVTRVGKMTLHVSKLFYRVAVRVEVVGLFGISHLDERKSGCRRAWRVIR